MPETKNLPRKPSAYSRLQWKPVAILGQLKFGLPDEAVFSAPMVEETDPLRRAFLEEGLAAPSVPGGVNAREEFVVLLRAAAEIEHALMVQYLYAWFTTGSKEDEGDPTEVFQKIAVQEMGHLFSVQNLLRALGEPVHLFLPEPNSSPAQNTFPFPLHLGTASRRTLAQYVTAESPLAGTLTGNLQTQARAAAAEAMIDVRHVGLLFLKLYWLAQPSDSPSGPWQPPLTPHWAAELGERHMTFTPLAYGAQRSWNSIWDVSMEAPNFLELSTPKQLFVARLADNSPVSSWEQVCRLFYAIGAQGEGYVDDPNAESHFERFLNLYNNWDSAPPPVIDTVTNPWIGLASTDPEREASRLTDPDALALATAFSLRYERILLLIALTFTPEVASQALIDIIRREALRDMRRSLVDLTEKLLKRPAKDGADVTALRAGPTFQAGEIPVLFNEIRVRLNTVKSGTASISWPDGMAIVNANLDQPLLDSLAGI